MDRAYHRNQSGQLACDLGYHLVVPPPTYHNPSLSYERDLNCRHGEVERFFCRLSRFRRIGPSRYVRQVVVFCSFVYLAQIRDAFQLP